MKRFILRVLMLLMICLTLFFGFSRIYLQLVGTDYLLYRDETLKYKTVPDGIEYAAFGSSHSGASFRPEDIPGHVTFNFFMSAQSPIMDAALYRLYRDRLADNAVVVLTISPMSLYCDPTDDMTHMKRYCNALPVSALPTLKTKLYRLFRVVDFRLDDVFEYLRTRDITDFSTAETNDILAGLAANHDNSGLDWTTWGSQLAAVHKGNIEHDPAQGPDLRVQNAMDGMLADCVARGYRVALYTPPFTAYYWSCFSEEFQSQMRSAAGQFAARYGIPYFDYSEDTRFCENMTYFSDVDHMSSEGSKAFAPILLADIDSFYN